MNNLSLLLLSILCIIACQNLPKKDVSQKIISTDITNFWKAYDLIQTTNDSIEQLEILQKEFIAPASLGQQRMIAARRYSAEEYLNSIRNHPKFWNSLRPNTEKAASFNQALKEGVKKLRAIYPALSPSTIYYTIGTHRSPGTGVDSMVMIGVEYALGDTSIIVDELREYVQNYYTINPTDHLQFLIVHEYVHTQQNEMVHELLPLCLYEGIAEFVAIKAVDHTSPLKAMRYGPENMDKIKERFEVDMFKQNTTFNWLWNAPNNDFQTADLGYYIGSAIASIYYENANDKQQAIKTLIELDYTDQAAIEQFVDATNYFSQPIEELRATFDKKRPKVIGIKEIENKNTDVSPTTKQLTILFSKPMHRNSRGFDFGPLGEEFVLGVQNVIGYSEDGKAFTFEVQLEPNRQYQSIVSPGFYDEEGIPIEPFLIDFKTGE